MRLYWLIGSAIAPDIAGPIIIPIPKDEAIKASPSGWVLLVVTSQSIALAVPMIPKKSLSHDYHTTSD